jgi:hypothetical protein
VFKDEGEMLMKFRKKPVVIEAFELRTGFGPPKPKWFTDLIQQGKAHGHGSHWLIDTLEGQMRADLGDYIIQGIKGEVYPCKPDIFAATYEPAEESK